MKKKANRLGPQGPRKGMVVGFLDILLPHKLLTVVHLLFLSTAHLKNNGFNLEEAEFTIFYG